ncbi:MAG: hypothetical protein JOZ75_08730, partial [Candidatus Dormibacteraeota bacterium]|nr:hypothetical protein [Candidatus Dormibacteraeota bacterium]
MATVGPGAGYARRRRVEQLAQSDIKRHQPPAPRSLSDAITGGTAISRRELRALLQPRSGPVTSLYLTLAPDPPEPVIAPLTAFHSMRHTEMAAQKEYIDSLERYARMRLERDLEEF